MTIAVVHDPVAQEVFEQSGVDLALNQRAGHGRGDRALHARPAHAGVRDGRARPAEVIEIEISPTSEFIGRPFRDLPMRGAIVGAIIRGRAVPSSRAATTSCRPGDRAIIVADTKRVAEVERTL